MPFNIIEKPESKSFSKVNYLKLNPGMHLVRLLENPMNAKIVYTHYVMGKYSIECPGEDCPICENNKKLVYSFKDSFRDQKGWSPKTTHYMLNVLDRTNAKICPSCQAEVKSINMKGAYPTNCPECSAILTAVSPAKLSVVKLLTFGVKLATDLNNVEETVCNVSGDPLGLMNFDVILSVDGAGRKKVTTPIPVPSSNDIVTVPEDALQDKENATIKLNAQEVLDLLRGVSLKDIFGARKTKSPTAVEVQDTPPWEPTVNSATLQAKIAGILDD